MKPSPVRYALFFIEAFINRMPSRVLKSLFWGPPATMPERPTIVIIEMGSDDSLPLLWRSVGHFVAENADVNIAIVHFRGLSAEKIMRHGPSAAVLAGYHQELSSYGPGDLEPLFAFLRDTELPVFAICGGFQFLAKAFGAEIVEMGFEERGYTRLRLMEDDPLFGGLAGPPVVYNWHHMAVRPVPREFMVLAESEACAQAVRHRTRPLYGVQFHPEFSDRSHTDSAVIFGNFLGIAGLLQRPSGGRSWNTPHRVKR